MKIQEEQEKRAELRSLLIDLSRTQDCLKDPKDRSDYFKKLENVYYNCDKENFRHFYSDIFSVLTLIDADPNLGSLDVLAQNMNSIKNGYRKDKNLDENDKPINIEKEIMKLYDHTNLDIARINYTKAITNDTKAELSKSKLVQENFEKEIKTIEEKANNTFEKTEKDIKNIQKEYISILGIFAAIILAFTGGIGFSTSVLENINKSSIYRITIISLIIGIVFINLIWVLIDFIRDINGKGNGKGIAKTWLLLVVNSILIIGIIFTCFSYKYDWFSREQAITNEINRQNNS